MAEDLGTWKPEQARVLLEALQQAGLTPKAKRTRDGVLVTVDDADSDEAHRTLVANMDAIAQAAQSAQPPRSKPRKQTPPRGRGRPSGRERPLASQRMGSLSRPLMILVLGLILTAIMPAPLRLPLVVFTVAGVVYALGKQTQDRDEP